MSIAQYFTHDEQQNISQAFHALLKLVTPKTTKEERDLIRKAFEYSLDAHKDARRKSGEPYILHPIEVARIVYKEIGMGAVSVAAALLHDVVEDTFAEVDDIEREFGPVVAHIVDGLTKISGVFDHRSSEQAENFRRMLLTLSDDIRVILIKFADRLHNLRTLQYSKKQSQLKIASETLYLYAPLANRLGLHAIKSEMEDLSLQFTEPRAFEEISHDLENQKRELQPNIDAFIGSVSETLRSAGLKFTIKSRFKSVYSIYAKMQRQGIPFEEVYDLFAIRIILDSVAEEEKTDCYKVYSLITQQYMPKPDRTRDWIAFPRANGYESLHVTVMGPNGRWIEVQIRSERMDEVAEKGLASHWTYKDNGQKHDEKFVKWISSVRDLLENPNMNAVNVVREFKKNLHAEELFVFTPKGDLIRLPVGGTVLDFAYEIHSSIGNTCIGAKVNNKVVPLSFALTNGDQVEILTSAKQAPKQEWLKFAVSSKARGRIKDALKAAKKKVAARGKAIFNWRVRAMGAQDQTEAIILELQSFLQIPKRMDLFYQLGSHKIEMSKLMEFIDLKKQGKPIDTSFVESETRKKRETTKMRFEEILQTVRGVNSDALTIGQDMTISNIKMASCCTPIAGDDVFGFADVEAQKVIIHRTTCPKAIALMSNYGKNILKARWEQSRHISFLSAVKISGEDRQGMMNDLIRVISQQLKLNIRSITIDSFDGMFEGVFKVFISGTEELEKLNRMLREVRGVFTVSRM